MSDISFVLDADESAALELKLGQYMVGQKGEQGQDGQQGPPGTLTPEDEALLEQAVSDAQGAANAASGSAAAAAQSAANAKTSETNSKASETASASNATSASTSAGNAASSAATASISASNAATSETNAAQWEALAKDWATKTTGTVDGVDYSAKYYALQTVSSAQAASNSAAAAKASETNAKTSETNAAASAAAAAASAGQAANKVDKGGDTMTGDLNLYAASGNYSPNIKLKAGAYTPAIRASGPSQQFEFLNSAYTQINFTISDTGDITTRGTATVGGSSLHMQPQGGGYPTFLDFHPNAGQTVRLGVQNDANTKEFFITNAANSARNLRVDDGGNVTVRGQATISGLLSCSSDLVIVSPTANQYSPWLRLTAQGYSQCFIRFNAAASPPCLEIYNNAINARNFTLDDNGNASVRGVLTASGGLTAYGKILALSAGGAQGEVRFQNTGGGSFYVRGRGPGGGLEFVNNAYSAVVANMGDDGVMGLSRLNTGGIPGSDDGTYYVTTGSVRTGSVAYGQNGTALMHYDAGGGNIGVRTGGNFKYFTFQVDGNANANNGTWVSSSSGANKTNIRQLTGALARLLALTGVSYTRTDDATEKTRLGFIAEDVQAVYPELVYTMQALDAPAPDANGKPTGDAVPASLGLSLGEFAAPIVEALREIAARLDALDGGGAG